MSDPLGCSNGGEFAFDESCTLEGDLEVELGHGEDAFTPLGAGPPQVHYGIQGGQHVYLGVRVKNPALDRYERVQISFRAWVFGEPYTDTCAGVAEATATCALFILGERTFVAGGEVPLTVNDGVIEEVGYTLVLRDWVGDRPVFFEAVATDPCHRSGTAMRQTQP